MINENQKMIIRAAFKDENFHLHETEYRIEKAINEEIRKIRYLHKMQLEISEKEFQKIMIIVIYIKRKGNEKAYRQMLDKNN